MPFGPRGPGPRGPMMRPRGPPPIIRAAGTVALGAAVGSAIARNNESRTVVVVREQPSQVQYVYQEPATAQNVRYVYTDAPPQQNVQYVYRDPAANQNVRYVYQ